MDVTRVTCKDLIIDAQGLLEPFDENRGGEYARGICELIAMAFGVPGVLTGDRAKEIERSIFDYTHTRDVEPPKDHEHCAGRTCWQDRYPCPAGGKSPAEFNPLPLSKDERDDLIEAIDFAVSEVPPAQRERYLELRGRLDYDPNIMAMDLEDHQAPQTERWVRRALLRLAADIIELESTLGDYPSAEDMATYFSNLENEDTDLERRVTDLENRFTDLEQP